jgi:hypothetical protein
MPEAARLEEFSTSLEENDWSYGSASQYWSAIGKAMETL